MIMDTKEHDTATTDFSDLAHETAAAVMATLALEMKKEKRKAELMDELNELLGAPVRERKQLSLNGLTPESAWCDEFGYVTSRAYITPEFRTRQREVEWWATYRTVLAKLISVDNPFTGRCRELARDEANYAHGTIESSAHMNVSGVKP